MTTVLKPVFCNYLIMAVGKISIQLNIVGNVFAHHDISRYISVAKCCVNVFRRSVHNLPHTKS